MKLAIEAPRIRPPTWTIPTPTALYRVAGLLITVCVPTLFWTLVLLLVTKGAGMDIGAAALAAFASSVAVLSMVGASMFMGSRD